MSALEKVKKQIVDTLNKKLGQEGGLILEDLVYPPDAKMCDLSLPCFGLAKELKLAPAAVAADLAKKVKRIKGVAEIKVAGPYLNFTLDKAVLADNLLKEIGKEEERFGRNKKGAGKKALVEYSNANTHKEYHVGHLRNITFGDSVYRLLNATGHKAIPFSYINDFGGHVAKTIWALEKFFKKEALPENKGFFLGKVYVTASKKLEENPELKSEVSEYMKAIESREGRIYKQWEKTRKWSIASFAQIYKELGVKFKETKYENEFLAEGLKLVDELLAKGILKKSEGAVIADLEQYGLGVLVFLRSDGTALYPVADLPLAKAKFDKYQLDKSIYVVDIRQSQYFKQLFKVLELLGYKQEMVHLGYDFVTLPSGMMSSRSGNVITYEELKQQLLDNARKSTKEKHPEWTAERVEGTAWKLAIGAIKFEMLKVGRDKTITFEIEKALRFDGFTSAYLQYTIARISSIIRKSGAMIHESPISGAKLTHAKEQALVMQLAKYPEVVTKAGETYDPSEIAKYIFELAQSLNDYYHEVPILKSEADLAESRLALIAAVKQVIENGMGLLGIEAVEEM